MSDPTVKTYSEFYIQKGEPVEDDERARFRFSRIFQRYFIRDPNGATTSKQYMRFLEERLGFSFKSCKSTTSAYNLPVWDRFFVNISRTDFLNCITWIVGFRVGLAKGALPKFIVEVQAMFEEQNLAYTINENGEIRHLVDEAFTNNQYATISALSLPRHEATLELLNSVDGHLIAAPQDFTAAISAVFNATENLFKLTFGVKSLNADAVNSELSPTIQRMYEGRDSLSSSSRQMAESFKKWIGASHNYRHAQGEETPTQPTEEFATLMISQGMAYLRWLAQIDGQIRD